MHHQPGPNHLYNSYNGLRKRCFVLQIIISSPRQCFRRSINNKKCFLSLIRRTLVLATTRTEICTQQPQYLHLTHHHSPAVSSHLSLFRFLSKSPVQFTSTGSALSALAAAHKFLCCGLAAQAGHYIVSRLSVNNVLGVLQEVSLHCPKDSGLAPVCSGNKVTSKHSRISKGFRREHHLMTLKL